MQEYRIGRLNGRFTVSWWEDGKRRRYRLDALTRKAAEAEALDVIAARAPRPAGDSVAALWDAYAAQLGDRPTGRNMRYLGASAVLPFFGAYRPDQIDTDMCRAYEATRAAAGKSQGTIHTELGYLRSTMTWARKMNIIDRVPHILVPPKSPPRDRWLTQPEIQRLLAAECQPHIRLAIILMLATAARVGAILDLTWDRVDLERGKIDLRLPDARTRKGRAVVPINRMAMVALQDAQRAALSDHVVEWCGAPVRSIRRGFAVAVDNAGLTGVTQHTLRHTAAVHMAAAGVPMSQISQYLGHSNTAITERVYARFAPDHLRNAADVLDFTPKIREA
jgi:integrase